MNSTGSDPASRIAPGDDAPLIPEWAAPGYLLAALICGLVYTVVIAVNADLAFNPAAKASGIVMLAVFALFRQAWLLALALAFSAVGDVALELGPEAQTLGIAAFGSAHIVYLAIFALRVRRDGRRSDGWIPALMLAAYGVAMWIWLSPGMGDLTAPASAYLGVILLMAIASGFVRGPRLIFIGAILFVLSDSIIAARWFQNVFVADGGVDFGGLAVWITYFAAQTALALGLTRPTR